MADKPFKNTMGSVLGEWLDRRMGHPTVTTTERDMRSKIVTLHSMKHVDGQQGVLRCKRVTFKVTYPKWWAPDKVVSLYHVCIDVPPALRKRYPEQTFEPMTYPQLCTGLLKWTTYPHQRAMQTYLKTLATRLTAPVTNPRT